MRFSTAFEHLLKGKAIRRYHWNAESCLRLKRGKIYVCTAKEHKPLKALAENAIMASDWQIVGEETCFKPNKNIMHFFDQLNSTL